MLFKIKKVWRTRNDSNVWPFPSEGNRLRDKLRNNAFPQPQESGVESPRNHPLLTISAQAAQWGRLSRFERHFAKIGCCRDLNLLRGPLTLDGSLTNSGFRWAFTPGPRQSGCPPIGKQCSYNIGAA